MKKKAKRYSSETMLDHDERTRINEDLIRAGFDGNGRFGTIGMGLSKIQGVLDHHGIEVDQILSAYEFSGDSGHSSIHLAFSDEKLGPVSIDNAKAVVSWHRLVGDRFEMICYVS